MSVPSLFLLAVSLGCASHTLGPLTSGGEFGEVRAASADVLPSPSAPLILPDSDHSLTLEDLVEELARLTGQQIIMDEVTQGILAAKPVVRGRASEIPVDEVYPFVENLLLFHGVMMSRLKGGTRPMIALSSSVGRGPRLPFLRIPDGDLHLLQQHPALLSQVHLELTHVDTRQITTSLRGLLTDVNTQTLLPGGEHEVLLRGTGRSLEGIVSFLKFADQAAARNATATERVQRDQQPDESSSER